MADPSYGPIVYSDSVDIEVKVIIDYSYGLIAGRA
jgi:hypothetical protein